MWRSSNRRTGSSTVLGECAFAVVDVETTGLFPRGNDRIVEIAIVRLSPTGEPEDEFVTLVNPERDIGPTRIHGITARDILQAPRFHEIAGDVAEHLAASVLVAHNARFDVDFLEAEFARITEYVPSLPALCTMTMAQMIDSTAPSYRLESLCSHFGLPLHSAHSALEDARATGLLFGVLLRRAIDSGVRTLAELGCSGTAGPVDAWPPLPGGGAVLTRQHSHERSEPSNLARLVTRLQAEPAHRDPETMEYVDLLDRVLEDRVVTEEEVEALFQTAIRWGLSQVRVLSVHQSYLEGLVKAAVDDGTITSAEREDLELVARLFGYNLSALEAMLVAARDASSGLKSEAKQQLTAKEPLAGLTVCFTGDSRLMFHGAHLSREVVEDLATKTGLVVKRSVAKDLDILVVVDAHSLSGKAQKARRYGGTRLIAEKVFWDMLGIAME